VSAQLRCLSLEGKHSFADKCVPKCNLGTRGTVAYNLDNTVASTAYSSGAGVSATPTVSLTYDPVYPRILTMSDPVTGTMTYAYNPITSTPTPGAGRLAGVTTPLTTISNTTSTGAPAYDELGRSLGQTIGGVSSSVTYDTLGRVVTETNALTPSGAFTYAYLNNTSRVTSITNPNGQSTHYTYLDSTTSPNEPRLSEIKNLNASASVISKFNYGYDSQGQITSWTQQTDSNDPQNWANQYDNEGKLINVNVTDTTTSALLHQYAYSYDAAGNRTAEQIDGNVTSSTYNNLNQLTGQSAGGKMVFSGTVSKYSTVTVGGNPASLDASNNFRGTASVTTGTNNVPIIAQDVDGNVATNTYQVVVPPSGSATNTYDLNGNLANDGSRTFSWDAKNELVKITYADTSSTQFTYNGLGQRVKIQEYNASHTLTSTKQYVWEGMATAEERDASNTVLKRYFIQGEQRINSGTSTNYFYTRDHLGSIREMVASNGSTISARYSYDPYGRSTKVSGSLDCDFQFTGYYYHAASGLYLSPTRAYNPNTGTWISRDPLGESVGLNLYAYCNGNPICNVDRDGKNPVVIIIIAGVAVLSIAIFAYAVYHVIKVAEANAATQTAAQDGTVTPGPNQQAAADADAQNTRAYPSQVLVPAAKAAMSAPGTSATGPIDVPTEEETDAAAALARKAAEQAADKAAEPPEQQAPAQSPQAPPSSSPCVDAPPAPMQQS
jgi:RHS repeat-associated protein